MTESPLALSLLTLPRQIGSTMHCDRQWSAPDDLGTSSMRVETGTPIPLSIDLSSVDDGVLVRVRTHVDLIGECVRCLDAVSVHHDIDTADVFFEHAPADLDGTGEDDLEGDEIRLIGPHDTIDLEALLRDAIITLVDDRPLCRPDCPGLCPGCGEKLDDLPDNHSHEVIDPRFAALASFFDEEAH